LNLSRRACRLADDSEATAPHDVGRQSKIHDVENIEELGAKFEHAKLAPFDHAKLVTAAGKIDKRKLATG